MNKVTVRAPVRADLAGGTLDLWPIYLFHPGARTVNVAISHYAESEVVETGGGGVDINLTDQQVEQHYDSLRELAGDPRAALIHRVLEHFRISGIRITTRTDAPRGSGLGGSSALAITLVRALAEFAGVAVGEEELVALVRDLETRLIGVPAGIQDYYPPVYGGLAALHLNPGLVVRHDIPLPVERLAEHMLLHYTGVAHFSGTNNWEMYKRQIEGKKKVHRGFERITQSAIEMEKALTAGDMEAAGAALAHEWANRKALIDGISTPEIEAAIAAATAAGAWGGKVCGAGGGGCIIFLFPPDRRSDIERALADVPGRILDAAPVAHGLSIERSGDLQATGAPARQRQPLKATEELEQLYVYGGRGPYRPFLLAEALVTHTEPRSGFHQTVLRTYAAPIDIAEGNVTWSEARVIDPESLSIHAVSEPHRRVPSRISVEALTQAALQAKDAFAQFVGENEAMHIFHNPAFGLYSQAHESREAFLGRCNEEAQRRLDLEAERLESTFRRRMDQLRERSERESRDLEAKEEQPDDAPSTDVNVAWGQTLYNITSGRPAAVAEAPQSVRETDYLERIAQVQRSWDKELQSLRDELQIKVKGVQEIEIVPSGKNIEIARYLILWASRL